jgi:hypothetical protein
MGPSEVGWKTFLAYLTGLVNQELPWRNEYLVTENHLLRKPITCRVWLNEGDLEEVKQKNGGVLLPRWNEWAPISSHRPGRWLPCIRLANTHRQISVERRLVNMSDNVDRRFCTQNPP